MSSNNTGTLVTAPIRPHSNRDQYPTAYANEIKGGHHTVSTLEHRNSIPHERRSEGMFCTVTTQKVTYQLLGGIENSNWEVFTTSGGGSSDGNVDDYGSITNNNYTTVDYGGLI
jgi:hypothetical protein